MALQRGRTDDLPADAIRLTEQEAVQHVMDIIDEHPDDWMLYACPWIYSIRLLSKLLLSLFSASIKFGPAGLGALGAATGMYVNSYYRNRLRLGKFGFIGSYIPIAMLPAIMCTLFDKAIIQPSIFLQKEKCPLCLQLRSGTVQGFMGVVYPSMLAPLAAYMVKKPITNSVVIFNQFFVVRFIVRYPPLHVPLAIDRRRAQSTLQNLHQNDQTHSAHTWTVAGTECAGRLISHLSPAISICETANLFDREGTTRTRWND